MISVEICADSRRVRLQELAPRRQVVEQVVHLDRRAFGRADLADARTVPPSTRISVPVGAPPFRVRSVKCATPTRCSAAPRRGTRASRSPRDRQPTRSCSWHDAPAPAARPPPSCRRRRLRSSIERLPPSSIVTLTRRAPASIEFSTSSLTTDAGRSTTSPAAI